MVYGVVQESGKWKVKKFYVLEFGLFSPDPEASGGGLFSFFNF